MLMRETMGSALFGQSEPGKGGVVGVRGEGARLPANLFRLQSCSYCIVVRTWGTVAQSH